MENCVSWAPKLSLLGFTTNWIYERAFGTELLAGRGLTVDLRTLTAIAAMSSDSQGPLPSLLVFGGIPFLMVVGLKSGFLVGWPPGVTLGFRHFPQVLATWHSRT